MDTHLEGDPGEIEVAADYLRSVAAGASSLADVGATARATLLDGWRGAAGSAFSDRARVLACSGDAVGATAERSARTLDALASALRAAQSELAGIRARAVAAGLIVNGTAVGLPPLGTEFGHFASPDTPSGAYRELRQLRDQIFETFELALDDAARDLRHDGATLGLVTANLLSAAYTTYLVRLNSRVLATQAEFFDSEARRLGRLAAEHLRLAREGRIRFDDRHYDDLLNRIGAAEKAAPAALTASTEIPQAASRLGTSLGVLATGAGVYVDIHDGEPVVQAVASQGTALLTTVATGAAVGSAIPLPVVGTAAGAVAGIAVGLVTDKFVDRLFEGPPERPRRSDHSGRRDLGPDEARIARLLGGKSSSQPPRTYPVPAP